MNKIAVIFWGLCLTGTTSLIMLISTIIAVRKINPLPIPHKVYQGCIFALYSFTLAALLRSLTNHYLSSVIMETVTIGTIMSICIEFLQFAIPKRTAQVIDLCVNIIGLYVGAIIFYIIYYLIYL